MRKVKLLMRNVLFVIWMLIVTTSCNKTDVPQGNDPETPQHLEEDLSFTRTLEEVYYKYDGIRTQKYKKIYNYDGNKELLYEQYRDGELRARRYNFIYNGLTRTYTIKNQSSEFEAYDEFIDDMYSYPKYGETKTNEGITSQVFYEYDGIKYMGMRRYSLGILWQETKDVHWDGLNCSYSSYIYETETGILNSIYWQSYTYLDDTYQRVTHCISKPISNNVDNGITTETFYQYDGKKPIGKQEYWNGVLREEYKDYVYDGNRCTFKQLLYGNNGELVFEGEGYTVYYNP